MTPELEKKLYARLYKMTESEMRTVIRERFSKLGLREIIGSYIIESAPALDEHFTEEDAEDITIIKSIFKVK